MKKIMATLLIVAAAINAMAVDYTAKAKVTLTAVESGFNSELTLSEAAEYGTLGGVEMYMLDRKVALYALDGTTKLQIARVPTCVMWHLACLQMLPQITHLQLHLLPAPRPFTSMTT